MGRLLAILNDNNGYKLKVQRILTYNELPRQFQSNSQFQRAQQGELWLLDRNEENAITLIEPQAVIRHINISQELNADGHINKILYKYNNHWKLRLISLEYKHPSEYAGLELVQNTENTLPIYKLFIDLYYDDFGTFRNVYHSLRGVYIQFRNMTLAMRQHLRNHFILGFVPFGGSFDEFIKPFIKEMKQLEHGKIFEINGQRSLVIASIGQIMADLPQGNDLTGVKRHGATKGCRSCQATKDSFTDTNLDIAVLSRYHHNTEIQFREINLAITATERKNIATNYGLHTKKPILDFLIRERYLQTPQDIYHLTAGKI